MLLLVVVEGGTVVELVTGVGNGALLDIGVDVELTGLAGGVVEDFGLVDAELTGAADGVVEDFGLVDADEARLRVEDVRGAAVLNETGTVWLALKPAERVMLNPRAQVAASSPCVGRVSGDGFSFLGGEMMIENEKEMDNVRVVENDCEDEQWMVNS